MLCQKIGIFIYIRIVLLHEILKLRHHHRKLLLFKLSCGIFCYVQLRDSMA